MIFKKVRQERFIFHFIHQMASRENQSENVTPLKTATLRIVSKALANIARGGFTSVEKLFDVNGSRQDEVKPAPTLWKKNEVFCANTEEHPSNGFGPDFDLWRQKTSAVPDGSSTNTATPATKEVHVSTAWKEATGVFGSDSDAANQISQFMLDGESSSDEEDRE
jgi:hypothetical protein